MQRHQIWDLHAFHFSVSGFSVSAFRLPTVARLFRASLSPGKPSRKLTPAHVTGTPPRATFFVRKQFDDLSAKAAGENRKRWLTRAA